MGDDPWVALAMVAVAWQRVAGEELRAELPTRGPIERRLERLLVCEVVRLLQEVVRVVREAVRVVPVVSEDGSLRDVDAEMGVSA